ncbi:hypothetical protein NHQ30_006841 [Ciborinia camelliae]|nr:hypothetical protein NHQ30_006841 [Ciborinia camelliae]
MSRSTHNLSGSRSRSGSSFQTAMSNERKNEDINQLSQLPSASSSQPMTPISRPSSSDSLTETSTISSTNPSTLTMSQTYDNLFYEDVWDSASQLSSPPSGSSAQLMTPKSLSSSIPPTRAPSVSSPSPATNVEQNTKPGGTLSPAKKFDTALNCKSRTKKGKRNAEGISDDTNEVPEALRGNKRKGDKKDEESQPPMDMKNPKNEFHNSGKRKMENSMETSDDENIAERPSKILKTVAPGKLPSSINFTKRESASDRNKKWFLTLKTSQGKNRMALRFITKMKIPCEHAQLGWLEFQPKEVKESEWASGKLEERSLKLKNDKIERKIGMDGNEKEKGIGNYYTQQRLEDDSPCLSESQQGGRPKTFKYKVHFPPSFLQPYHNVKKAVRYIEYELPTTSESTLKTKAEIKKIIAAKEANGEKLMFQHTPDYTVDKKVFEHIPDFSIEQKEEIERQFAERFKFGISAKQDQELKEEIRRLKADNAEKPKFSTKEGRILEVKEDLTLGWIAGREANGVKIRVDTIEGRTLKLEPTSLKNILAERKAERKKLRSRTKEERIFEMQQRILRLAKKEDAKREEQTLQKSKYQGLLGYAEAL